MKRNMVAVVLDKDVEPAAPLLLQRSLSLLLKVTGRRREAQDVPRWALLTTTLSGLLLLPVAPPPVPGYRSFGFRETERSMRSESFHLLRHH